MSVRHIAAVIDSDLKRSHRGIAIVYANSANDEDNAVALSAAKVAAGSGYEKRQAVTLTDELELEAGTCGRPILQLVAFGDLPDTAQVRLAAIPKRRMPKVYLMHMGCNNCTPLEGCGVQSGTVRGAKNGDRGVQSVAPEPEERTGKEPVRRSPAFPKEQTKPMFTAFCLIFGTPVGPMRAAYGLTVNQALEAGITPDQIGPAARRYRRGWDGVACTPMALLKHWNTWGPEAAARVARDQMPPEVRAAYERNTG